ncbi:sensor histidine kinase [Pedobacter hartonius]|uniref:Histidine kinase n=1 Tax=Pedobacter hartonius TaxID=425514 RepID=A0A1H4HFW6_9SPHI|nr:histidine kinase [Pedobacter hartonius]SEB20757.1 Histidine kinase [Pedobacter hartonius]
MKFRKKTTLSLYWKCQLIGWSLASLYWSILGALGGQFKIGIGLVQFFSDVALYNFITHLYRIFALKNHWQDLNLTDLFKRIIPAIVIMAILYTLVTTIKVYGIRVVFSIGTFPDMKTLMGPTGIGIFVAGIRLMAIWMLAFHLYYYARREIRIARENTLLKLTAKQAQLSQLTAQLNPHFLFNSLNTIKSLISISPKLARRAVDLLSELLGSSLYEQSGGFWGLDRELDLVRDYLELETLRMQERLTFEIEVSPITLPLLIPRLCLQTLVENAVKHGISQLKQGGKISILISYRGNLLEIKVENPVPLQQKESASKLGLENLRERLKAAYNEKASFEININPGAYAQATLKLPLYE